MKLYVVQNNNYAHEYHDEGYFQGPDDADIDRLWKIYRDGGGSSEASDFRAWLIQNHGFEDLDIEIFNTKS